LSKRRAGRNADDDLDPISSTDAALAPCAQRR